MPNFHSQSNQLINLTDAVVQILEHIHPLPTEKIPLSLCLNRILQETVPLPFDLPSFDHSAMDGYALGGETTDGVYHLVGTIPAGASKPLELQHGECVRIFTGASIPPGADRVAIQEECTVHHLKIHIAQPVKAGSNIRHRGENGRSGDLVLADGELLNPVRIGIAASLGKTELSVSKQPSVWIITTGNELIEPGSPLMSGQIYNSNAVQLAAQVTSFGGNPNLTGITPDHLPTIVQKINQALQQKANVICISAGVSVGEADYTREALKQCGFEIHFHGVDLKPGKPALFATQGSTLAFGIPGNPVSHLAVFALLIAPALRALQGLSPIKPCFAKLKDPWKGKTDHRDRWFPSIVKQTEIGIELQLLPWKGSGDLIVCHNANAVANIPSDAMLLPQGTMVRYVPLSGHIHDSDTQAIQRSATSC